MCNENGFSEDAAGQHDSYPDARIVALKEAKREMKEKLGEMRTFDTGATRDSDKDKFDYEGFLSPIALERYAEYMHENRKQSDGKMRDSDNWQKGIPREQYMKSLFRHFMDLWIIHRGWKRQCIGIEDALCAVIFNAMGMLHEHMVATFREDEKESSV